KASLNNTIKTCTGKISTCVVGIYCTKVIDPIRAVPDTTGTVLPDAIPYKVKTPSAFIRPFGSTPGYSRFVFGRTYIPGFVYFNKVHHNPGTCIRVCRIICERAKLKFIRTHESAIAMKNLIAGTKRL